VVFFLQIWRIIRRSSDGFGRRILCSRTSSSHPGCPGGRRRCGSTESAVRSECRGWWLAVRAWTPLGDSPMAADRPAARKFPFCKRPEQYCHPSTKLAGILFLKFALAIVFCLSRRGQVMVSNGKRGSANGRTYDRKIKLCYLQWLFETQTLYRAVIIRDKGECAQPTESHSGD